MSGPCLWPNSGCPTCDGLECLNKSQRLDVEAWAANDLWEATGRVYGTCPVSVLPCNVATCGWCENLLRSCACGPVPEIKLPGPVASVTEVMVNGEVLNENDYRIDDYQWLVRLDGERWPTGNAIDPDIFRVDYLQGIEPPAGAGLVTGILACERAKAICGDKSCRLPREMQQVSRQGVTMVRGGGGTSNSSRPWRYAPDSVTVFGLPEVDQWVNSANAPMFAGAIHSPDLPTVRRITWPTTP